MAWQLANAKLFPTLVSTYQRNCCKSCSYTKNEVWLDWKYTFIYLRNETKITKINYYLISTFVVVEINAFIINNPLRKILEIGP